MNAMKQYEGSFYKKRVKKTETTYLMQNIKKYHK